VNVSVLFSKYHLCYMTAAIFLTQSTVSALEAANYITQYSRTVTVAT